MRAHPPIRVPITRSSVTQLIRRGSIELGHLDAGRLRPLLPQADQERLLAPQTSGTPPDRGRPAAGRAGRRPPASVGRRPDGRGDRPLRPGHHRDGGQGGGRVPVELVVRWPPSRPSGSPRTRPRRRRPPRWSRRTGPRGRCRAERRVRSWSKTLSRAASVTVGPGSRLSSGVVVPGSVVSAGAASASTTAPSTPPPSTTPPSTTAPSTTPPSVPPPTTAGHREDVRGERRQRAPRRGTGHEERVTGRAGRAGRQHRRAPGRRPDRPSGSDRPRARPAGAG